MPDQAPDDARNGQNGGTACPSRPKPTRLKRRADFLHVGKGRRWHGKAMTLQMSPRRAAPAAPAAPSDAGLEEARSEAVRFGFTLTKKVGNAVVRNRARRRLREAVRLSPDLPARPGHDYVVVGRLEAIRLPFEQLLGELARAVDRVHAADAPRGGERRRNRRS